MWEHWLLYCSFSSLLKMCEYNTHEIWSSESQSCFSPAGKTCCQTWITEVKVGVWYSQFLGDRRGIGTSSVCRHVSPLTWCLDVNVQLERGPEPPWNHNHTNRYRRENIFKQLILFNLQQPPKRLNLMFGVLTKFDLKNNPQYFLLID